MLKLVMGDEACKVYSSIRDIANIHEMSSFNCYHYCTMHSVCFALSAGSLRCSTTHSRPAYQYAPLNQEFCHIRPLYVRSYPSMGAR